ncbi:MAG: hypothetical protein CMJ32_09665 [Phycisphaerae bacterium]|nr:hypothetical protein [Phycisphaerae bacterium]
MLHAAGRSRLLFVRIAFVTQSISHTPTLQATTTQAYRDWLGVAASVLCAIHCAAMPFVIGFLPLLGLSFLADPAFHQWMVGICLALALLAFIPGWRRHHKLAPGLIGIVGLSLISLAAFAGPDECCPTPCEETTALAASEDEATCAESCCAPGEESTPPAETALAATAEEEAACTESCCPADTTVDQPSTAGFTSFMWLIMTPLGGVFLVAAHLCNHFIGARCAAGCCSR